MLKYPIQHLCTVFAPFFVFLRRFPGQTRPLPRLRSWVRAPLPAPEIQGTQRICRCFFCFLLLFEKRRISGILFFVILSFCTAFAPLLHRYMHIYRTTFPLCLHIFGRTFLHRFCTASSFIKYFVCYSCLIFIKEFCIPLRHLWVLVTQMNLCCV